MQLTKDQAREESLRRWRALPADQRETIEHAQVFAAALADELDFRTMGNARRVIASWLVQDLKGEAPWGNLIPESIAAEGAEATLPKPAEAPVPLAETALDAVPVDQQPEPAVSEATLVDHIVWYTPEPQVVDSALDQGHESDSLQSAAPESKPESSEQQARSDEESTSKGETLPAPEASNDDEERPARGLAVGER